MGTLKMVTWLTFSITAFISGCYLENPDATKDAGVNDAAVDADADTDTDTDADMDVGSDADTGSIADIDTDTDTNVEASVDSDMGTNGDTGEDIGTGSGAMVDTGTNTVVDAEEDTGTDGAIDAGSHQDGGDDAECSEGNCICEADEKWCSGNVCVSTDGCCGDGDCQRGYSCVEGSCMDTLAPQIVSVSPNDGAVGVTADATVQITFGERMNESSVASAISVSSLPLGELNLSWNADSTVLTISPENGFVYATGVSRETTAARSYSLALTTSATDLAGNGLAIAFSSTFSTLRRIVETVHPTDIAYWGAYYDTMGGDLTNDIYHCPTETGAISIFSNYYQGVYMPVSIYMAMNTAQLGNFDDIQALESAIFKGTQREASEGFFIDNAILLREIEYGWMTDEIRTYTTVALLGNFATSSAPDPAADITDTFLTEWSSDNAQFLFHLYAKNAIEGGGVSFSCDGFALEITYLMI